MPKVKIQKIVDAAFAIGVFITGILINLIVKAINSKIEIWKKKIVIAIYSLEILSLVYCVMAKDFIWVFVAITVNFQLELLKKQTKDNID